MSKLKVLYALLASFGLFFFFAGEAHATHFRYGLITYSVPDPLNAPKTVRFDVVTAWRSDFVGTTDLQFGDSTSNGSTTGATIGTGTDSAGLQYKVQRYSVTHTYPAKSVYTAFFTDCCRISSLVNAGDDSFRVEAIVDLTTGNTANPVTALPAIIQLQTGGIRTIEIPAIDPDGVPVHCRFATPAESLAGQNPPVIPTGVAPTLADTPTGCTMTWNTANGADNQSYSVSIIIESFNGPTKSDSNLDFIVQLKSAPPPTCAGGGVFNVDLGAQLQQAVIGTNTGGGMLKMTNIGTFGAISPAPGTTQASPFTTTYSIAPSIGDQGVQIQTIVFTNTANLSGFCNLTIKVPQCPEFGNPCATGVGGCEGTGYQYCLNGAVLCSAVAGQPTAELCDNIDNNCDGTVDEGNPEAGTPCTSAFPGICAPGTAACNNGVKQCTPNIQPGSVAETCDGIDQDCDGAIDDGFGVGDACVEGDGQCLAAGLVVCDGSGGTTCDAEPAPPTAEICDGKDNDCNQQIDDGFPLGDPCTVGVGACEATGAVVCDGSGGTTCDAVAGLPGIEICGNDTDEDCDGALDNACADTDGDGLFDDEEVEAGLPAGDADSDDDGVLDGDEPEYDVDSDGDGLINALDPDSDNDGLFDGTELGEGCDHPDTAAAAKHCIADADPATTTDPLAWDTDTGDSSDGSEDANLDGKVDSGESNPLNAGDDDMAADLDADGLGNALEATLGTKADDADTDDDGLIDGDEANPSCDTDGDGLINPRDVDSDNDALFDGLEKGRDCMNPDTGPNKKHCKFDGDPATTTGVLAKDTDKGSVMDGSEDVNLNGVFGSKDTDPNDATDDGNFADTDQDGLTDALEATLGSNPNDKDSDDDGVLDGDEANPSDDVDGDGQPNLLDPDSDGDGLFDGLELGVACDQTDTDVTQGFCVIDADAGATTTNPLLEDTDAGGVKDGDEDLNKDGAIDKNESDPNDPADDVPVECLSDADCGAADSGRVCDNQVCVSGCRGAEGNTCPENQECSSTDTTIGECSDISGTGGSGGSSEPEPTGCGCRTAGSPDTGSLGLVAFAGLALLAAKRRRSR